MTEAVISRLKDPYNIDTAHRKKHPGESTFLDVFR